MKNAGKRPLRVSKRAAGINSFIVMDILEQAQQMERAGESVVHMEVGEPDFDTPEPIKKAGVAAIEQGRTKYTHSQGLIELRRAVAGHMKTEYGVAAPPETVVVTPGTSNALLLVLAAILDPGGEVIMADPGYPCYPNFVRFLGGKPVFVKVLEDEGFQLDPGRVKKKITDRTRAILINSPSNPTGALLEPEVLRRLAALGPLVISDEIYHGLVYEGEARSILELTDRAVVIDGFSKRYAMTGWRLGYAIVPPGLADAVKRMQQNINISPNSFVQWAGVEALKEGKPYVEKMRKTFDERRKFLLAELARLGLPAACPPRGAFYVFVNAGKLGENSLELAGEILRKAKVAVTPGIDFGPGGEGFLRFSYANSMENLKEGVRRLENFLENER
ncbi:MAG: pyridoxal phosphate-dependent aminotransferase [Candidatus Nitrospinota bacterium M3_3B_026]